MKKITLDIVNIILGSFLFALSINLFVIPNDFGEGGVTGASVILYYLFGWSPGITSFILNGILIIVGYKFLNKQTIIYTIICIINLSLAMLWTKNWTIQLDVVILNSILAGIITGVGLGLIFRAGGTVAGSSILAKLTQKYLHWNISYGLLFFDLIVVFASWFIIGAEGLILTILMLYIATKVMDYIIEGKNSKRPLINIFYSYRKINRRLNKIRFFSLQKKENVSK